MKRLLAWPTKKTSVPAIFHQGHPWPCPFGQPEGCAKCSYNLWEGRFKSQALLDEKALAACVAYVDLNPLRAAMAKTPEESKHTSVKKRAEKAKEAHSPNHPKQQAYGLLPFAGNPRQVIPEGIEMRLTDYLDLVDSFVSSMILILRAT